MRHFRKTTSFLIALSLILAIGCSSKGCDATENSADYPKKTITGVIPGVVKVSPEQLGIPKKE